MPRKGRKRKAPRTRPLTGQAAVRAAARKKNYELFFKTEGNVSAFLQGYLLRNPNAFQDRSLVRIGPETDQWPHLINPEAVAIAFVLRPRVSTEPTNDASSDGYYGPAVAAVSKDKDSDGTLAHCIIRYCKRLTVAHVELESVANDAAVSFLRDTITRDNGVCLLFSRDPLLSSPVLSKLLSGNRLTTNPDWVNSVTNPEWVKTLCNLSQQRQLYSLVDAETSVAALHANRSPDVGFFTQQLKTLVATADKGDRDLIVVSAAVWTQHPIEIVALVQRCRARNVPVFLILEWLVFGGWVYTQKVPILHAAIKQQLGRLSDEMWARPLLETGYTAAAAVQATTTASNKNDATDLQGIMPRIKQQDGRKRKRPQPEQAGVQAPATATAAPKKTERQLSFSIQDENDLSVLLQSYLERTPNAFQDGSIIRVGPETEQWPRLIRPDTVAVAFIVRRGPAADAAYDVFDSPRVYFTVGENGSDALAECNIRYCKRLSIAHVELDAVTNDAAASFLRDTITCDNGVCLLFGRHNPLVSSPVLKQLIHNARGSSGGTRKKAKCFTANPEWGKTLCSISQQRQLYTLVGAKAFATSGDTIPANKAGRSIGRYFDQLLINLTAKATQKNCALVVISSKVWTNRPDATSALIQRCRAHKVPVFLVLDWVVSGYWIYRAKGLTRDIREQLCSLSDEMWARPLVSVKVKTKRMMKRENQQELEMQQVIAAQSLLDEVMVVPSTEITAVVPSDSTSGAASTTTSRSEGDVAALETKQSVAAADVDVVENYPPRRSLSVQDENELSLFLRGYLQRFPNAFNDGSLIRIGQETKQWPVLIHPESVALVLVWRFQTGNAFAGCVTRYCECTAVSAIVLKQSVANDESCDSFLRDEMSRHSSGCILFSRTLSSPVLGRLMYDASPLMTDGKRRALNNFAGNPSWVKTLCTASQQSQVDRLVGSTCCTDNGDLEDTASSLQRLQQVSGRVGMYGIVAISAEVWMHRPAETSTLIYLCRARQVAVFLLCTNPFAVFDKLRRDIGSGVFCRKVEELEPAVREQLNRLSGEMWAQPLLATGHTATAEKNYEPSELDEPAQTASTENQLSLQDEGELSLFLQGYLQRNPNAFQDGSLICIGPMTQQWPVLIHSNTVALALIMRRFPRTEPATGDGGPSIAVADESGKDKLADCISRYCGRVGVSYLELESVTSDDATMATTCHSFLRDELSHSNDVCILFSRGSLPSFPVVGRLLRDIPLLSKFKKRERRLVLGTFARDPHWAKALCNQSQRRRLYSLLDSKSTKDNTPRAIRLPPPHLKEVDLKEVTAWVDWKSFELVVLSATLWCHRPADMLQLVQRCRARQVTIFLLADTSIFGSNLYLRKSQELDPSVREQLSRLCNEMWVQPLRKKELGTLPQHHQSGLANVVQYPLDAVSIVPLADSTAVLPSASASGKTLESTLQAFETKPSVPADDHIRTSQPKYSLTVQDENDLSVFLRDYLQRTPNAFADGSLIRIGSETEQWPVLTNPDTVALAIIWRPGLSANDSSVVADTAYCVTRCCAKFVVSYLELAPVMNDESCDSCLREEISRHDGVCLLFSHAPNLSSPVLERLMYDASPRQEKKDNCLVASPEWVKTLCTASQQRAVYSLLGSMSDAAEGDPRLSMSISQQMKHVSAQVQAEECGLVVVPAVVWLGRRPVAMISLLQLCRARQVAIFLTLTSTSRSILCRKVQELQPAAREQLNRLSDEMWARPLLNNMNAATTQQSSILANVVHSSLDAVPIVPAAIERKQLGQLSDELRAQPLLNKMNTETAQQQQQPSKPNVAHTPLEVMPIVPALDRTATVPRCSTSTTNRALATRKHAINVDVDVDAIETKALKDLLSVEDENYLSAFLQGYVRRTPNAFLQEGSLIRIGPETDQWPVLINPDSVAVAFILRRVPTDATTDTGAVVDGDFNGALAECVIQCCVWVGVPYLELESATNSGANSFLRDEISRHNGVCLLFSHNPLLSSPLLKQLLHATPAVPSLFATAPSVEEIGTKPSGGVSSTARRQESDTVTLAASVAAVDASLTPPPAKGNSSMLQRPEHDSAGVAATKSSNVMVDLTTPESAKGNSCVLQRPDHTGAGVAATESSNVVVDLTTPELPELDNTGATTSTADVDKDDEHGTLVGKPRELELQLDAASASSGGSSLPPTRKRVREEGNGDTSLDEGSTSSYAASFLQVPSMVAPASDSLEPIDEELILLEEAASELESALDSLRVHHAETKSSLLRGETRRGQLYDKAKKLQSRQCQLQVSHAQQVALNNELTISLERSRSQLSRLDASEVAMELEDYEEVASDSASADESNHTSPSMDRLRDMDSLNDGTASSIIAGSAMPLASTDVQIVQRPVDDMVASAAPSQALMDNPN